MQCRNIIFPTKVVEVQDLENFDKYSALQGGLEVQDFQFKANTTTQENAFIKGFFKILLGLKLLVASLKTL